MKCEVTLIYGTLLFSFLSKKILGATAKKMTEVRTEFELTISLLLRGAKYLFFTTPKNLFISKKQVTGEKPTVTRPKRASHILLLKLRTPRGQARLALAS